MAARIIQVKVTPRARQSSLTQAADGTWLAKLKSPPAEALKITTWTAAQTLGMQDRLGSISAHKSADLILIDGDPVRDISNVRRISMVLKAGQAFYPAEIYEAIGVKRFVNPPSVVTVQ
jgi:imidazolonepropionase-like amidohydrolase